MTSHELARLLLARRDNDLAFEVRIDDGQPEEYAVRTAPLLCDDDIADPDLRADGAREPIRYHALGDRLVVRLGVVFVGRADV